jgi:hypothetical protein
MRMQYPSTLKPFYRFRKAIKILWRLEVGNERDNSCHVRATNGICRPYAEFSSNYIWYVSFTQTKPLSSLQTFQSYCVWLWAIKNTKTFLLFQLSAVKVKAKPTNDTVIHKFKWLLSWENKLNFVCEEKQNLDTILIRFAGWLKAFYIPMIPIERWDTSEFRTQGNITHHVNEWLTPHRKL